MAHSVLSADLEAETTAGNGGWFSWTMVRRMIGLKSDGRRVNDEIIGGHENGTEEHRRRRNRAADSGDGTACSFGSEMKTSARDRGVAQFDMTDSDTFSAQRAKSKGRAETVEANDASDFLTSKAAHAPAGRREDNFQAFEPIKNGNNELLAQQLAILQDEFNVMKRKMNKTDDTHSAMASTRNVRHNQLKKNVLNSIPNENYTINEDINKRMDKFEDIVSTLLAEKESLVKVNSNMAREINCLKSKLASVERYEHKHCVRKSDFDLLKIEIKSHINQTNNVKNDLNDVQSTLCTIEKNMSNYKDVESVKAENTRKYDKLKMRLCILENKTRVEENKLEDMLQHIMTIKPSACKCGRANEPVTNVHNYYSQQPYSVPHPGPPMPSSAPPSPPPAPPSPPTPTIKPPRSQVAPPDPPGQYPRYTINNELLRDMASQLRKHDSNNIRKIPRRADMRISSVATKTADQVVPLPPPSPLLPITAPVAPEVPTEPILPLVDLESIEVQKEPPQPIVDQAPTETPPTSQFSSVDLELIEVQKVPLRPIIDQAPTETPPTSQFSLVDLELIDVQKAPPQPIIDQAPTQTPPTSQFSLLESELIEVQREPLLPIIDLPLAKVPQESLFPLIDPASQGSSEPPTPPLC